MPIRKINNPLIVSMIIGNGFVHARANNYDVHFASMTGISQTAFTSADFGSATIGRSLEWLDARFVWGEETYNSSRLQTSQMGSDKIGTATHKRLLIAALYELFGAADITPDALITTLPVYYYQHDRDDMRSRMAGDYHLTDDQGNKFTYSIAPEAVKILPEGLPTVYDYIYTNALTVDMQNSDMLSDTVGVVNIGTYTTDFIMIKDQKPVLARCMSEDVGLSFVWDEIKRHAKVTYGRTLSDHEADQAMKNGFISVGNRDIDIVDLNERLFEQMSDRIANEINTGWDNGLAVRHMIEAGGGGPQLHSYLAPRYNQNLNYYYYETVEDAASTEMNGAWKLANIKLTKVQ